MSLFSNRNAVVAWKNRLKGNHAKAYRWIKESSPPMPRILLDRNNLPTGDSSEQLKAAQQAWSPFLRRGCLEAISLGELQSHDYEWWTK